MDPECIFCKIVAGEAPASKVYEDDAVIAILDIFPWVTGHTLVIPRVHAPTIFDISEQDSVAVMGAARRLAPAIVSAVGAEGMNLLQSNGSAAWQTVAHFHMHLIPRKPGDGLVPPGKSAPADPDEIRRTAAAVADALD